jgi:branched-chain amino acid transport system ATP-binding protein
VTALLEARQLVAGYRDVPIVRNLDLTVEAGEVVALLGPNGAGKSTTMLTLAGELPPLDGNVEFSKVKRRARLYRRARAGMAFVTEERSVFMGLTVAQNLRVGRVNAADATALFPELDPILNRRAGLLSGGEQQMLTLARALARRPRLLLADELSLGLAPLIVQRLLSAVRTAADDGLGVLLVEQQVHRALDVADRVVVLRHGSVEFAGTSGEARSKIDLIQAAYLTSHKELTD